MFNQYFLNLTNINQYLTTTGNQFYKVLVASVIYRLSIGLYQLYRLNISLLRFLSSILVRLNLYLTNTYQYILKSNIIG